MSPVRLVPPAVPTAVVRPLSGAPEQRVPVQQVAVSTVPAPSIVPRQIDPVGLRLMALQLENDELRAELQQLQAG